MPQWFFRMEGGASVPVNSLGTKEFRFRTRDAMTLSESACTLSINTVAKQSSAPVITSFAVSPIIVSVGSPYVLSLNTSGSVTSALLDGSAISLQGNGSYSQTITPQATGRKTYTVTLNGPGGTSTQQTSVIINPKCSLTANAASGNVGQNYPFHARIEGGFINASIIGLGLNPVFLAGSSSLVDQDFLLAITGAQGSQKVTLSVVSNEGGLVQCDAQANLLEAIPSAAIKINGQTSDTVEVLLLANTTLVEWNVANASSCIENETGLARPNQGSFKIETQITRSRTFTLVCKASSGQSVSFTRLIKVIGSWVGLDYMNPQINTCSAICPRWGFRVGTSPEGYTCASGVNRPQSMADQDTFRPPFTYGCTDSTCASVPGNRSTFSSGEWCLYSGQPRSPKYVDRTVGCYCLPAL